MELFSNIVYKLFKLGILWIILLCFKFSKQNYDNEAILQPMNPQQRSMADDTITKNYFPNNSDTNGHFSSTEFIDLLRTNAMTKDGLIAVATVFDGA
jgi:hypothetical protein